MSQHPDKFTFELGCIFNREAGDRQQFIKKACSEFSNTINSFQEDRIFFSLKNSFKTREFRQEINSKPPSHMIKMVSFDLLNCTSFPHFRLGFTFRLHFLECHFQDVLKPKQKCCLEISLFRRLPTDLKPEVATPKE